MKELIENAAAEACAKPELWTARREEILDAATALFAERGYSETDTQVLADKIGVGKGTLYRYFPSKRELFLAAVDRGLRLMRERVDSTIAGIDEPFERIARGIEAFLGFFAEHPQYVELLIQERAQFKDREKPTYFVHRENNRRRWLELYRGLIGEGRVRDMPVERITDVIHNLLYGTMCTNFFTGQHKAFKSQARDIVEIVFFGILTDPERKRQRANKTAPTRACEN
jgi:AcrR family transcriptional regulator